MSKLCKSFCSILLVVTLTASCASTRLHHDGMKLIENGDYEQGLAKLAQATREDPSNLDYRAQFKARHEEAVLKLLGDGDRARGAAKLDEADRLYRRVLVIEPGNDRAKRGLDATAGDRRHGSMIDKAGAALTAGDFDKAEGLIRSVVAEDPGFAAANAMQAKIDSVRGPIKITPRLKSRENRPVTLQFRDANTKMVFEVLSRQTGVNFVFDKDVRSDGKTTIFVQQVPVEQAVELVLGQNQLARQVLSDNMVLIYPNTAAKQKEYQDEIVKTFYLTNTDPKKAQELLKTVLNTKTLFVDDKANMIVMRDTPEAVRMAEKLISSLDLAESEVMLEVEVLEISRSRLQQLGINYPTSASVATPTKLNLDSIGQLNTSDISISSFSASVDLLKQVGLTNTLASPRIRARNREKAKILIGSRVPVITNSVTPTSSGSAVVTGSVQYLDVGLTLDVEPTVHLDNEVSIKLNLEVSSITKQVKTDSGTIAYEIGTRNAQTLLSLRDGETQILAGLIQDSDTRNSSHIPGLGDIPLLGRLFGSVRTNKDKSEIVLSITPRVIRSSARPSSETTEFWYGTESNVRTAPLGSSQPVAAAAANANSQLPAPKIDAESANAGTAIATSITAAPTAAAGEAAVAAAAPDQSGDAGGMPPGVATPGVATPGVATPGVSEPSASEKMQPSAGGADTPTVSWSGATQARVGENFDVIVNLSTPEPLTRIKSQLRFDGKLMQLISAEPGSVIPTNLAGATPPRIMQRSGIAQYVVPATKEAPVQGSGSFLTLHFKALSKTPATGIVLQLSASNVANGYTLVRSPAPLTVSIVE